MTPEDLKSGTKYFWELVEKNSPFAYVASEAKKRFGEYMVYSPHFRLAYALFNEAALRKRMVTASDMVRSVNERVEEERGEKEEGFTESVFWKVSGIISARELAISGTPLSVLLEVTEEEAEKYVLPLMRYMGYGKKATEREYLKRMAYAKYS